MVGYQTLTLVTVVRPHPFHPQNQGDILATKYEIDIPEYVDLVEACEKLISSHDVGDPQGEADGWVGIREALKKIKE